MKQINSDDFISSLIIFLIPDSVTSIVPAVQEAWAPHVLPGCVGDAGWNATACNVGQGFTVNPSGKRIVALDRIKMPTDHTMHRVQPTNLTLLYNQLPFESLVSVHNQRCARANNAQPPKRLVRGCGGNLCGGLAWAGQNEAAGVRYHSVHGNRVLD